MDAPSPKSTSARRAKTPTRGVHHLALTTEDMKMTTDFYVDVLGMPLVHAMKVPPGVGVGPGNRGNPPFEELRHYFFDMGGDSLLAFFEIPKGAKPQTDRDAIGGMQHLAFSVTRENFEAIQVRLRARGIDMLGPAEILPDLHSVYFYDPNGIRLEMCCCLDDGDSQKVIDRVAQTRDEMRPELETVTADGRWVDRLVASLPE